MSLKQAETTLAAAQMIYAHIEDASRRALASSALVMRSTTEAAPRVRRLSNQFFFEKLLITEDTDDGAQVAGAVLNEPWATLV